MIWKILIAYNTTTNIWMIFWNNVDVVVEVGDVGNDDNADDDGDDVDDDDDDDNDDDGDDDDDVDKGGESGNGENDGDHDDEDDDDDDDGNNEGEADGDDNKGGEKDNDDNDAEDDEEDDGVVVFGDEANVVFPALSSALGSALASAIDETLAEALAGPRAKALADDLAEALAEVIMGGGNGGKWLASSRYELLVFWIFVWFWCCNENSMMDLANFIYPNFDRCRPSTQKRDLSSSPVIVNQLFDGWTKTILPNFCNSVQFWCKKVLTWLISVLLVESLQSRGSKPVTTTLTFGIFFIIVSAMHVMLFAISIGESFSRLLVPHWSTTSCIDDERSKFSTLHRTCSTRSPPIPKLRAFLKYCNQTSGYLARPAAIESPITMDFGFITLILSWW